MVEKDLYTFRLPVDLMRQIDKITNDKSDFVTIALQAAINQETQPSINMDEEIHHQNIDHNDEFLNRYLDRLESDLEFWKDKYEVLQLEYYDQVRDSIKRLDSKFERIMYSVDESKIKPPLESISLTPNKMHDSHKSDDNSISNFSKEKNSKFTKDNK